MDQLNAGKILLRRGEFFTEFIPYFGCVDFGSVLQRQFGNIDVGTPVWKLHCCSSHNWKALRRATTNGTVSSHNCCKRCRTLGVSLHTRGRVGVLRDRSLSWIHPQHVCRLWQTCRLLFLADFHKQSNLLDKPRC